VTHELLIYILGVAVVVYFLGILLREWFRESRLNKMNKKADRRNSFPPPPPASEDPGK